MFCSDLDDNLREMGVGDLAVPKQMRRFGEAFYGRQAAYLAAFAAADDRELEKALARNIFAGADSDRGAARLAHYARAALRQFEVQEDARIAARRSCLSQPRGHRTWLSRNLAETCRTSVPRRGRFPLRWRILPTTGQHFDLIADASVRAAVARDRGIARSAALAKRRFDVTRRGAGGLHVTGRSRRRSGKTAWSRLNRWPMKSRRRSISSSCRNRPRRRTRRQWRQRRTETEPRDVKWNDPEPLIGGVVDLGALATEFLILGLDPYPRKPGAVFEPPPDHKPEESPVRRPCQTDEGSGWPLNAVVSGRRTAILAPGAASP